jgi:hypothetical protein
MIAATIRPMKTEDKSPVEVVAIEESRSRALTAEEVVKLEVISQAYSMRRD